MRVLDQCCGAGRVSLALARRGVRVVGVDAAEGYISLGREEAEREALPCELHCADARDFQPATPCDAAFNWWSSMGNLESDEQDVRLLRAAQRSLKPGGCFALELPHAQRVREHFQPRFETRNGSQRVERESALEAGGQWMRQRWRYFEGGVQVAERETRFRLYAPDEVAGLMTRAGFVEVGLEDEAGAPLSAGSLRLVARGRAPGP